MVHYPVMVKTALPGLKFDAKFIVSDTGFQFILFQYIPDALISFQLIHLFIG